VNRVELVEVDVMVVVLEEEQKEMQVILVM